MNEQIRAEYEKEFPVPPQTMWSEQYGGYINCAQCPNFAAAVHQEGWVRWQAAHARYAGRCQYIATGDGGTSYCRLAAQPQVPDGYSLIANEILDRFPELNMSNYGHDDVGALNNWGVELVLSAQEAR